MTDELKIDSKKIEDKLVEFIRRQTRQAGFQKTIVGLSGGLDSSLVAYLCSRALGNENIFGLILPYKTISSQIMANAKLIAQKYRIRTKTIDISPQVDAYFKNFPDADKIRRGNKMARERMSVLYDQAKELNALVAGTSNKSEILLGYGTLYGDLACAFNPIGRLYKTQLRQLAKDVGIPKEIIQQAPTAGLWPGQTDEEELGLTYVEVDKLLYYLVDKKYSENELAKLGFKKDYIDKVKKRIADNSFKGRLPAIAAI